jgi:hypothetical protein
VERFAAGALRHEGDAGALLRSEGNDAFVKGESG